MTAQWKTGEFDTFLSVNAISLCKYFEYIRNYILCLYTESNHKLYFFSQRCCWVSVLHDEMTCLTGVNMISHDCVQFQAFFTAPMFGVVEWGLTREQVTLAGTHVQSCSRHASGRLLAESLL